MDKETFLNELNAVLERVGEAMAGLSAKLDKKVDVEEGKGLSSHDFSNSFKEMLDEVFARKAELEKGGTTKLGEENARLHSDRFSRIELEN